MKEITTAVSDSQFVAGRDSPTTDFGLTKDASTPRTTGDVSSLFEGLDTESYSDIPRFCSEFVARLEKLDGKATQVFGSALETSSKLITFFKHIKERTGRISDSFDQQSKSNVENIQKSAMDLFFYYQGIESKIKEMDRYRLDLAQNVASPSTLDRVAASRHRPKIILPNAPIVHINSQGNSYSRQLPLIPGTSSEHNGSVDIMQPRRSESPTPSLIAQTPAPKMFAKLPKEVTEANLPKPEIMRLSAVYELIETESDYCRDLSTMINFYKPLVKDSRLLSDAEFTILFSNVEQLLAANQVLLTKLNARRDQNLFIPEISELVGECAESFKVYKTYAANYPAAMKIVHSLQAKSDTKEILQSWMLLAEARGLSLESFLIKPVQRICKYPLLLRVLLLINGYKELEKNSEKAGNFKDAANARVSFEKIEAITMLVNEATRAAEERQRILNLESQIESPISFNFAEKRHLKDGTLPRLVGGKPKDRYVILFTDTLLICKPSKTGATKWELESAYSLAELILKQEGRDSARIKTASINFSIITSDEKESLSFVPYSDDDRAKWIDVFFLAFKDITEEHRSAVRSSINHSIMRQSAIESNLGMGSLRGMGTLTSRKAKPGVNRQVSTINPNQLRKAAARKTMLESFGNPNAASHLSFILPDPEMVDIAGTIYRRAFAATGHTYYFSLETKHSIWKLPEGYTVIDPSNGKAVGPVDASSNGPEDSRTSLMADNSSNNGDDEEMVGLELVDGFADWRKVDRGDGQPYFFNVNTKETRWDPPSADEESADLEDVDP